MYDTIIIGAGPAGLTAAIYATRRKLKTLVLSKDLGGQIVRTNFVENYPGIDEITGPNLAKNMEAQAEKFGAEIKYEEAQNISKTTKNFIVKTDLGEYETKTLILAFGKTPRSLGVPGEEQFRNKGVSYCVNCDAPLFKDKIAAVIGGGNAAFDAVHYLSKIAKKVYLIHRRTGFRADETTIEQTKKIDNAELVLDSVIKEVQGDKFLKKLIIENVKTKEVKELEVDGLFVEIGSTVETDFAKHLVELDELKQIKVNDKCETSCPGIFACGDVTIIPFKQATIAVGEGAKAALQAYNYIHNIKPAISTDWGKSAL